MLNGIDPIIIFQFGKLSSSLGSTLEKIPLVSEIPTIIEQPPIPLYLSETLTGIYIDSEDKNVDIATDVETKTNGTDPDVNQKGIQSTIAINLVARKDSLGLSLLSAMIDLIFDKVTSKEYAITYLHGPITVFRGVLHSYAVNQNSGNELLTIKIELSKGEKQPQKKNEIPETQKITGARPL